MWLVSVVGQGHPCMWLVKAICTLFIDLHPYSTHTAFLRVVCYRLCFSLPMTLRSVMSYPAAAWIITNLLMTRTCSSKFEPKRSSPNCLWSILALLPSTSGFAINELLNAGKSEVMFFGTSAQLQSTLSVNVVTVAGSSLPVTTEMRILGVILDSRLSFDNHVTAVCRACNYHIWALRHIRLLLPDDVARTLACSIVNLASITATHLCTIHPSKT